MSYADGYYGFFVVAAVLRFTSMFRKRRVDEGTRHAHWTTIAMSVSILSIYIGSLVEFSLARREVAWWIFATGAAVYAGGLLLRYHAISTLGRYFSTYIEIREGHKLVRGGLYSTMRHPNYLGLLLEAAGFPLIAGAFYTLAGGMLLFLPVILIRIAREEREMVGKFGRTYSDFQREVFALIPLKKFWRRAPSSDVDLGGE